MILLWVTEIIKIIPCVFVIFSLNSLNVILTWSCIVRKDVCLFILKIFGLNHNNNNTNFVFKGFFYVETLKVFGKTTWQKLSFSCHPKRSLLFSQKPPILCRVILFLQEAFRMFSEFLSLLDISSTKSCHDTRLHFSWLIVS